MAAPKAKSTTATRATKTTKAAKVSARKAPAKTPPATKAPVTKTAAAKTPTATSKTAKVKSAASRTADLSQDVFTSVEAGQRTAIAAVRTFVDTVDAALPALGAHPSRREKVIDAALEMADKLVTTQYHFLRQAVRGADRSLRLSNGKAK